MNTTLITGSSTGIGAAFARKLATRGRNVLLVARSEDKLITLCNELGRLAAFVLSILRWILNNPMPVRSCLKKHKNENSRSTCSSITPASARWATLRIWISARVEMIDLNVKALVELTHRFLVPMRERKQGTIINVASTAGFQSVPFMATYAATKAFVLSFSEALWEENRKHGVHVMALCPGVTETNFFEASHMDRPPMRTIQSPEAVVDAALRGLRA